MSFSPYKRLSSWTIIIVPAIICNFTFSLVPCSADTNKDAIELNNQAVKSLNASNFDVAISLLERALTLDSSYKLARGNLAIAYNNRGLAMASSNPAQALTSFHNSLFLDSSNATTFNNLNGMVKLLGKNPDSPSDRESLGDKARDGGDYRGATMEYLASFKLKQDNGVKGKLVDAFNKLTSSDKISVQDEFFRVSNLAAPTQQSKF